MATRFLVPIAKAQRGGRGKPTRRSLEILGNKFEGVMRADLKGAFSTFAKGVNYDLVADAVYSGDWKEVFSTLPIDDLQPLLTDGMEGAGRAMVKASDVEAESFATMTLPEGGRPKPSTLSVGLDNDKVLRYIGTRTGELIQNVTADLQTNVQSAVAVGIENRLSPRQVAGLIRDGLPLSERQQRSLEKYKAGLAETNLPAKRQRELSDRMRDALADSRATTIARTESQMALNQAQKVVWDNARQQGIIGNKSRKKWECEAEPCHLCIQLQGMIVGIDEPFVVPSTGQAVDMPVLHINCRCQCALIPGD